MSSALYQCLVTHERFSPRVHRFRYHTFSFCLDLADIDALTRRIPILSRNRFNVFSYYDSDHIDINQVLVEHGIRKTPHRIRLITNLRIFGYTFNPVSFYFCDDAEGNAFAAVAEVNNTFGETKTYVINADELRGTTFESRQPKEFYISPFVALDVDLHLRLAIPDQRLGFVITDMSGDSTILQARMTGKRNPLTTARLLWFSVKYPLLTLQVIAAIHWQALRLWMKRIPLHRKSEHPELQRGVRTKSEPLLVPATRNQTARTGDFT